MAHIRDLRPLSPHLSIYKPQITSAMSIFHRITGFALSVGAVFLVAWLWGAAYSESYFGMWTEFYRSTLGMIMLMGWSFCFFYHWGNGLRHLMWDMGRGFDLASVTRTGIMVILFALGMTGFTWFIILSEAGV